MLADFYRVPGNYRKIYPSFCPLQSERIFFIRRVYLTASYTRDNCDERRAFGSGRFLRVRQFRDECREYAINYHFIVSHYGRATRVRGHSIKLGEIESTVVRMYAAEIFDPLWVSHLARSEIPRLIFIVRDWQSTKQRIPSRRSRDK